LTQALAPALSSGVGRNPSRDDGSLAVGGDETLSKNRQQETPRASLVLAAFVGVVIVGAAVAAMLLSASPGRQETATKETATSERPYVGGDLHSLAVDPTDPEKVMVGGHDGGAVSEDGGRTWKQASGLEGADPMGWAISPDDPQKMYVGVTPASTSPTMAARASARTTRACPEPTCMASAWTRRTPTPSTPT
jgi:hypothetical protein